MGMFTSVTHPETGHEIQFRTGKDNCDRYVLGQEVDWWVNPREPMCGRCLDGVYDGESCWPHGDPDHKFPTLSGRYWIVIKDHKIHAIEPVEAPETAEEVVKFGCFRHGYSAQEAWVARRHGVEPPSMELWSQEAWAQEAQRVEKGRQREADFKARTYGMSADDRMREAWRDYMQVTMQQEGFFRRILPPMPVTEVAA